MFNRLFNFREDETSEQEKVDLLRETAERYSLEDSVQKIARRIRRENLLREKALRRRWMH